MKPPPHLLFVYGTLKRGGANHPLMAGQKFLGTARTTPGFTLYDLDGYPGMIATADDHDGVKGEVWAVDDATLARLDEFEGLAEGLYRRERIPLLAPFADRRVEAYLYTRDVPRRRALGTEWRA
jgi:gamma-glutamylcyclotransferase (GGCT)/AIG2-like uncharacterized protein YtfP